LHAPVAPHIAPMTTRPSRLQNGNLKALEQASSLLDDRLKWEYNKAAKLAETNRGQLKIDDKHRLASLQLGRAVRMQALDDLLEAEFGDEKQPVNDNFYGAALPRRGKPWFNYIENMTQITRQERRDLDQVDARLARLREEEAAKQRAEERAEQARIDAMADFEATQRSRLAKDYQAAQERLEDDKWPDKPKISIRDAFERAVNPKTEVQEDQTGDSKDGTGVQPPSPLTVEQLSDAFDEIDKQASERDKERDKGQDRER